MGRCEADVFADGLSRNVVHLDRRSSRELVELLECRRPDRVVNASSLK
jgi:hypothetical protein